jgi:beta-carotene hydroxylase
MSLRMPRPPKELLRVPDRAWPTLMLFAVASALFAVGTVGGSTGLISLWVAIVAIAFADYAAFTVAHEASHGLLGRKRRILNQVVGEICSIMLICRFNGFRQVHLRHHRHANDPELDPDRWAGMGPRWQLPFRWATADLHYWAVYDRKVRLPRMEVRVALLSLATLLSAVGILLVMGFWKEILLLYILPARIALFVSTYFFDYLPHQRPHGLPRSVAPHQAAVVVRGGSLIDAILLGHSLHLVHHLNPSVPWYRLRRVYGHQRDALLAAGAREVTVFSRPRPFDHEPAVRPPRHLGWSLFLVLGLLMVGCPSSDDDDSAGDDDDRPTTTTL